MRSSYFLAGLVYLTGLIGLAGCSSGIVPVSDQSSQSRQQGYHVVQPGDTLYSISFQAGLDYRDVARWNRVSPPYVIHPGQRVRLRPGSTRASRNRPATATAAPRQQTRKPAPRPASRSAQSLRWSWPSRGRLIRTYSRKRGSQGIDISGRAGQPVLAAATGKVVYAGSGLRGYGQLIIIKHDETFLSAYAHNEKVIVREGNSVRRGQRIGAMGRSGTDRVKLHFEIRKRGSPVDPLRYLPH